MKLTLVLLAAAASAQKPAPPVVTVAPVAIPAVRAVGGDYGVRSEAKVVPLLVEVSVGGTILWSGAMRVNAVGARYSSSFSQAPDMPCARPSYRNVFENSLSLNIRAAYDSEGEADRFEVNVSWARPANSSAKSVPAASTIVQPGSFNSSPLDQSGFRKAMAGLGKSVLI